MSERVDGIFSIDKFYEFLENKRRLRENHLDIKVSSKDLIPLFNIQGDQYYVINLTFRHEDKKGIRRQANSSEKYINRIYVAGMASCIVNYRISVTSNASGREYEEYKTILDVEDFKSWFTKISFNRVLIPDTNALMNRSLSSLCFVLGNDYLQNLTILIPRLSVLEMERIATQDGSQDKEKYNEQKRKVMSAVAELFFLKRNKGQFLPELDDRTLWTLAR